MNAIAKIATIRQVPSPVGHALGGLATAWFAQSLSPDLNNTRGFTTACVVAAVIPDIDILFHSHRTYTHSIGAALIVAFAVWLATRSTLRSLVISIAYATHVLLDWLGKDTAPPYGLMALWPFSSRYFVSGLDVFMEISRRYWKPDEFIWGNLKAGAWELLLLGGVALYAFYRKRHAVAAAKA